MSSLKSTFELDEGESMSSLRGVGGRGWGPHMHAFGEIVNFRRFCIFVVALPLEVDVGCPASLHYFKSLSKLFARKLVEL